MIDTLIRSFVRYQIIRRLIGGQWYLIADYQRNRQYWLTYRPEGYQILDAEEWM